MAKTKSFADKMLKSKKPKEEYEMVKVIEARTTPEGTVRYETKMKKIGKGESELKALGLS